MKKFFVLSALCGLVIGCDSGGVQQKQVQIKMVGPIDQVKRLLEAYVNGQAVGSESTGFQEMIDNAKKEDAAKGAIIETGLKEIEKLKGSPKAKAKEILGKL